MPTFNDFKQSRFLKKEDFVKPVLLTIKGWHEENVAMAGANEEIKPCVDFEEVAKPLILNSTRNAIITHICGTPDFDRWVGHRVVCFHDPTIINKGQVVGGIGVRPVKFNVPGIAPTPQPPAPRPTSPKPAPPAPPQPAPVPSGFAGDEGPAEEDDVPF